MSNIDRNLNNRDIIEKGGPGIETTVNEILELDDSKQINLAIRNLVEKDKDNSNIGLKLSRLFYKIRNKKELQHTLNNETFLMCYKTSIVNSDGKIDIEIFRAWSTYKYYDFFQGLNGKSIETIREICDKMTKNSEGESSASGIKFWTTIILSSIESFDEKDINLEDILTKYFNNNGRKNFSPEIIKDFLKRIIRAGTGYIDVLKKYCKDFFGITKEELDQLVQEVSAEK